MERAFDFTGDRDADWEGLCRLWRERDEIMSGAVGLLWRMPPQHKVCIEFAEAYPDSKEFLISKLSDTDPRIAAYAFKTLIRIPNCDLKSSDLPPDVFNRKERIRVSAHCLTHGQRLREFFSEYFQRKNRESISATDERAISWQDNELARYLDAIRKPPGTGSE
jgi:hypothetical protein